MHGKDVITIVRLMAKHKSVLREQAHQQINFKVFCFAKHFKKCFELPKGRILIFSKMR